jgi:SHS family lactate transporter-like MFS transporter
VKESEVWEKKRHLTWSELGRAIAGNWKILLRVALLMVGMGFASHGTQDMYPTFLQRHWGFDVKTRTLVTAISMLGAIAGGVLVGLYSDSAGRRRAIVLSLIGAILVVPLWAFAPSMLLLILGAFAIQFFVQGAWGVIPAHITELSPDSVRGFLPGFAYQCGIVVAGTITTIEALLAEHMSYAWAMALAAVFAFALAATLAGMGNERKGIVYGGDP